jgi:hypothetical protein
MPRPLLPAAALMLLAPFALAACAEAPPPAAAPAQPPPGVFVAGTPREISPVDHEMLAIGQAEEQIDRLFPGADAPNSLRKAGPGVPPPPPPPPARPADRDASKDEPRAAGLAATGDPCAVACKALASMVSSAERLCHLAGENDGRCDDARARVRGASARVKSSCPGCAVPTAPAAAPRGTPAPEAPKGPAPGMPGSSTGLPMP